MSPSQNIRTTSTEEHDDLIPYSPMSVPPRDSRHPSFRDDVRRTLFRHRFQPSRSRHTAMSDLYSLFLSDNGHDDLTEHTEFKFRSALGRVLSPPSEAGDFAKSYTAPSVRRIQDYISMVSPDCAAVNLVEHLRELKRKNGHMKREAAKTNNAIHQLKESRRVRRLNQPPPEPEVPQYLSFRYVDEFISLNCAEDLLQLKVFPNGKEMAESMSAYAAVREHLMQDKTARRPTSFTDTNIKLLAVGDGCTPRTASLFAYRTQWKCVSVDPLMRSGLWDDSVSNLSTHRARIQDVRVPFDSEEQRIIVVMWHAHVSIRDALSCITIDGIKWDVDDISFSKLMRKRVSLVSCACCNFDNVQMTFPDGSVPDDEYEDVAVPGEKRSVRVWRFL